MSIVCFDRFQSQHSTQQQVDESLRMYRDNHAILHQKLELSVAEINKGNEIIEQMQKEIQNLRLKLKNRIKIIKQQEQVRGTTCASLSLSSVCSCSKKLDGIKAMTNINWKASAWKSKNGMNRFFSSKSVIIGNLYGIWLIFRCKRTKISI